MTKTDFIQAHQKIKLVALITHIQDYDSINTINQIYTFGWICYTTFKEGLVFWILVLLKTNPCFSELNHHSGGRVIARDLGVNISKVGITIDKKVQRSRMWRPSCGSDIVTVEGAVCSFSNWPSMSSAQETTICTIYMNGSILFLYSPDCPETHTHTHTHTHTLAVKKAWTKGP